MGRLCRFALRHKLLVGLAWLVVAVVGAGTAGTTTHRLTEQGSTTGSAAAATNDDILALYGSGGRRLPVVAVITLPPGRTVASPGVREQVGRAFAAARVLTTPNGLKISTQSRPARVVDYATTGDRHFVTSSGASTYALVFTSLPGSDSRGPSAVRAAVSRAAPPGATVGVTSFGLLATGGGGGGPGVLSETLAGGLGALAVLAFVFGSLLALLPMLIAAVSILATFLVVLALTLVTDVSFIVQYLVALIGLGVAIDYSLLVVTRWREERAHGLENEAAIQSAMDTAGHAVLFSGLTVAVGLLAMVVLPVGSLRSIGYGGVLIPLVSVVVTGTLLPVVLAKAGRRLDWPRLRSEEHASRGWAAWARFVVRHRAAAATLALVVLGALALPATGLALGEPGSRSLVASGPAADALHSLTTHGVPSGVLTPVEVLVSGRDPEPVAARLATVPGVSTAIAPGGGDWRRAGTAVVEVLTVDETLAGDGLGTVGRIRAAADLPGPGQVRVGGRGAAEKDFINAIYGSFPLMLAAVVLITFVLLVRAFRSIVLPAKAVLLNLLSLTATYGFLVVFWQNGHGSKQIFNIEATGSITEFVPLMVFAFLFGLSMDYEVFILARMREEYDASGSTRTAVVEGLGRTGRLVTSAALILFLAFASLASGPETDVKVFATALGVGILLDATVVRALLVPALVSLFGDVNWWLPDRVRRLLLLPPASARPPVGTAGPAGETAGTSTGADTSETAGRPSRTLGGPVENGGTGAGAAQSSRSSIAR